MHWKFGLRELVVAGLSCRRASLPWAQFLDTAFVLYPQLQDIDFRIDAPSLDVPVYMVIGEHEARGRAVLANEWFDLLDAPSKKRVVFDGAGHRAHFDQPGRFAELMARILDQTRGSG